MQRHATAPVQRRRRPWLPDAELDANPIGSWSLEMTFDLWIRAFYCREILLPEDFRIQPGTVIASNHQRDVDGPMLGTVLVRRRGLHFQWPLPFYATREDLFRSGILSRLTMHWPPLLSALLGRMSLAWFFPLGRAEPMRRVREFTLGETLRMLCATGCTDDTCSMHLNTRGCRELGVGAANLRLCDALQQPGAPLETLWGLRRLTRASIKRIAPSFRATVDAQIAHFAERLDRGRCVYFSPEGTISASGHFGRVRQGFLRLARTAATPPWIQPIGVSYDTLAPGRSRVLIHIGQAFRADTTLDRRAFDATLRRAVLALEPITPSHLLARFLRQGPRTFTRDELVYWLTGCLATMRARGTTLDPAWARMPILELTEQRLRWLVRKRLVARDNERFRNTCPHGAKPGWRKSANIVRYLDNSLTDLAPMGLLTPGQTVAPSAICLQGKEE
ncbi:MAG: lysophospholipid acyltransferase family protein [Rhodanobacteraceae bacterium]